MNKEEKIKIDIDINDINIDLDDINNPGSGAGAGAAGAAAIINKKKNDIVEDTLKMDLFNSINKVSQDEIKILNNLNSSLSNDFTMRGGL